MRFVAGLMMVAVAGCTAAEYRIGPESGSEFAFEVAKTGLYSGKKHRFLFSRYTGRFDYDAAEPAKSRVEFTLGSASLSCTDTWVDSKDLKKIETFALQEMLAVSKYPEIRFQSTKVEARSATQFDVEGMLTVRGIAKAVVVHVTAAPAGAGEMSIAGSGEVKLRDYGLKPPSAALGAIGTKNEMAVSFRLTARGQ